MDTSRLDPELAALLADIPETPRKAIPSIKKKALFSSSSEAFGSGLSGIENVDLTTSSFTKIEKFFLDKPHNTFSDPSYYKKVLGNEPDSAKRLHELLSKYLTCQDPKDRSVYRQQLITVYWDFMANIALKAGGGKATKEKQYALRFGLLLPTLLTDEQRDLFSKIIEENTTGEPIYYLDEWLRSIGAGKIGPSTTDEVKSKKKDDSSRFQQLLSKAQGKLQSAENLMRAKSEERTTAEDSLKKTFDSVFIHDTLGGFPGVKACYTDQQKRALTDSMETSKQILVMDRDLNKLIDDYQVADGDVRTLQQKVDASGGGETNASGITSEYDTLRQMAKMTCGRQGNHFPIVSREYFHCAPREIGTRENVIDMLHWIETIDPEAYCRQYKSQLNRIPPFVILIPSYGDIGFCWEPFDRYNRITSRGRIAIPMYSRNLRIALLTAVADLRWQVAKEKASYYWMEEGLTGNYYQWFQSQKLKGDVKEYFINDYLLWMLKESEGIQKLTKEVRAVFWRFMPFTQEIKDKLKPRALVYQELCQRDRNRELSDGY
ncbi:MAG TPA: hypothetical protein GXZ47_07625 [Treponema sp.]|nr:hypothetical protein [Treponema sp.]